MTLGFLSRLAYNSGVLCKFARELKADFHNQKEAFAINHKSYKLKILIYVYNYYIKHLKLLTTEGSWFFD